tara:strand:- start:352 stop:501 length:150 start_codon:yes stop_codon:yes gene_type:complete
MTIATGRPCAGAAAPASVAAAEWEARVGLRADEIFPARDLVVEKAVNCG